MTWYLDSALATETVGKQLAHCCQSNLIIYLHGDLGSGKTTLTRGFLRGLGHLGNVKSPTYTLVESYLLESYTVYHFDLYRLLDPEELEYLGIRDYLEPQVICLIEWAARGQGYMPSADLECFLKYQAQGRTLDIVAKTARGEGLLSQLSEIQQ